MIITAAAAISLAAPSAVLAHDGEHHGAGERHHHHRGHHRHAHVLAFHAQALPSTTSGASSTSSTPVSDDKAGTIASFTNGVLTLTLTDGSNVSGKVSERTEIECSSTMATAARDGGQGEDNGQGDDNGNDGQSSSGPGDGEHHDDSAGSGDTGDDDAQDEAEHCTTAALVPGASVKDAFLSVSSEGSTWVKVEL
jgi:hypothetical protein